MRIRHTTPPATVWQKWQCGAGARWTSVNHDYAGKICDFAGCGCGTAVQLMGKTADRAEAHKWFRQPPRKSVAAAGKQEA